MGEAGLAVAGLAHRRGHATGNGLEATRKVGDLDLAPAEEPGLRLLAGLYFGGQVYEVEVELVDEAEQRFVVGIDELAAELGGDAFGEHAAGRVGAAAGAVVGLEDGCVDAGLLEPVGADEAGEPGADDGDAGVGG